MATIRAPPPLPPPPPPPPLSSSAYDIPDSTDWLATPLADLMPIESLLRCQVCKDFFTTPMITSCSHTFCSLCIRRYLGQESKCPACREPDQEVRLRKNPVLEELVAGFVHARPGLLAFARRAAAGAAAVAVASGRDMQDDDDGDGESYSEKKDESESESESESENERPRPKKRRKVVPPVAGRNLNGLRRPGTRSQSMQKDEKEQDSLELELEPQPYPHPQSDPEKENDGLVDCPSCSRRVKASAINSHLDRCLSGGGGGGGGGTAASSPPAAASRPLSTLPIKRGPVLYAASTLQATKPSASSLSLSSSSSSSPSTTRRLPTINYSLLNESRLRSKLKDLGIPSTGSKELMSRRHTEWVNLWNANCDSLQQLSKRDLLRQLDVWERTQGGGRQTSDHHHREAGGGSSGGGGGGSSSGVMARDFDRQGYMQTRKSEYDALIAQARARARAGKAAAGEESPAEGADARLEVDIRPATTTTTTAAAATNPQDPGPGPGPDPGRAPEHKQEQEQDHNHNEEPLLIPDSPINTNQPAILS